MTLIGHKNVKNWCNTVKKAVGDKWSTAVVIEMSEMLAQLISILSFWERSNTNITSFCHRYCPLAGNFFTTEKIRIDLVNGWTATNPFFTPYIWKTYLVWNWLGFHTGNQRTTREWMRPGNQPTISFWLGELINGRGLMRNGIELKKVWRLHPHFDIFLKINSFIIPLFFSRKNRGKKSFHHLLTFSSFLCYIISYVYIIRFAS
jgi:hypothetical protein